MANSSGSKPRKSASKTPRSAKPKKTAATATITRADSSAADRTTPGRTGVVLNSQNSKLRAGGKRDASLPGKFQDGKAPGGRAIPSRFVVAATFRTANTCAHGCVFRQSTSHPLSNDGEPLCYPTARINGSPDSFSRAHTAHDALDTYLQMDKIVQGAAPNQMVRHLVSGDVQGYNDDYINAANWLHEQRPDLRGYGYTHADDAIAALAKGWTLNRSVETAGEAASAIRAGLQAFLVSPEDDQLAGTVIEGRRVQTCPNDLNPNVGCAQCGICASNAPNRPIIETILHGNESRAAVVADKIRLKRAAEAANTAETGGSLPKSLPIVSRVPKPDSFEAGKAGI